MFVLLKGLEGSDRLGRVVVPGKGFKDEQIVHDGEYNEEESEHQEEEGDFDENGLLSSDGPRAAPDTPDTIVWPAPGDRLDAVVANLETDVE